MAAMQAPPGLDLTEDRGPEVTRTVVPVAVLATLTVICRLYSRKLKKLDFAAHDFFIIGGLVLAWGCAAEAIIMAHYGMGMHVYAVSPGGTTNVLKTLFSFIFIFDTAIVFIKASIILFYRYLFPTRMVKISLWAIGAVVIAWWFLTVFMGLFLCTPVAAQWNKTIPNFTCIDNKKYYIATAVPNTVTDIALLFIPVFQVWNLQMPLSQRILISGIFLVGIFECAVSVVRIVFLFRIGDDFTWDVTDGAIWGSLEPSVGVICACLPTMLPFADSFIFKPVRNITSSLQEILRPSSNRSDETLPSRQRTEDAKKWHRLQEDWPANSTFARGGTDSREGKGEVMAMDGIGVRRDVDVVGIKKENV